MLNKKQIVTTLLALPLAACVTTQEADITATTEMNLPESKAKPSESELNSEMPRVLVLPTNTSIDIAKKAGAHQNLTTYLETTFSSGGSEVIDRSLAAKLEEELLAFEATGKAPSGDLSLADYVVIPKLTVASVSSRFSEGGKGVNLLTGEEEYVPPKCFYSSEVTAIINVYSMPDLKPVSTQTLSDTESSSEDARYTSCPISQAQAHGLLQVAAKEAITDNKHELLQLFAAKGYALEHRVSGDGNHYIAISLGSKHGMALGQDIQFSHYSESKNPLTNKVELSAQKHSETGTVIKVQDNYSYVEVSEKLAGKLNKYDLAEPDYEPSAADEVAAYGKKLLTKTFSGLFD